MDLLQESIEDPVRRISRPRQLYTGQSHRPYQVSACLPSYLSACRPVCLPVSRSICLPVFLPVCLSACLPARLPACFEPDCAAQWHQQGVLMLLTPCFVSAAHTISQRLG